MVSQTCSQMDFCFDYWFYFQSAVSAAFLCVNCESVSLLLNHKIMGRRQMQFNRSLEELNATLVWVIWAGLVCVSGHMGIFPRLSSPIDSCHTLVHRLFDCGCIYTSSGGCLYRFSVNLARPGNLNKTTQTRKKRQFTEDNKDSSGSSILRLQSVS